MTYDKATFESKSLSYLEISMVQYNFTSLHSLFSIEQPSLI